MTTLIHTSDQHGYWHVLPEADVYVFTGDMLDNHPIITKEWSPTRGWKQSDLISRRIDPEKERRLQEEWYYRKCKKRGKTLRRFLKSPDAPVVVVRGNHDFVDLGPMFGGEVFEITEDPTRTVTYCGLKFGGFRGIPYIAGEWSDEEFVQELEDRAQCLPYDLDVVCTHAGPAGVLQSSWGMQALSNYINRCKYQLDELGEPIIGCRLPKLFCFGHVHFEFGEWVDDCGVDGTIIYSNAAQGTRKYEL